MYGHVLLHGCHDRRVLLGRPGLPHGVAWRCDVAAILVLFNGIAHDVTAPIAICAGWSIRLGRAVQRVVLPSKRKPVSI